MSFRLWPRIPQTRSAKRKAAASDSGVLSDDDSVPRNVAAKKTRQSRASPEEDEEPPAKPAKKKPGPKAKPKPKEKAPAKPKAAPKKKQTKAVEDSDDDVEVAVKPKDKPARAIVLMVPEATSEGSQRLSIQSSTGFEDALELIHETIGCVGLPRQPTLAYKLSTATKSAPAVNLRTQADWNGLLADVLAKVTTKKDISVTILVLPDNYMLSLRATRGKKKKGSNKKGKMTVMDLDKDDSEEDDDEDVDGIGAAEKKAMSELDAEYRKCVRCGAGYLCKVDKGGNHVHLNHPQRRAWAVSLACGTIEVTAKTPPKGELFKMFHGKAKEKTPPPGPSTSQVQYNPYYQYPMPPLGFGPPPTFPGYPHPPSAPQLPPAQAHSSMMSSDPPDDAASYPAVIEFIANLIRVVPQRESLRAVGETLDSLHYFQINEITDITIDELGTDRFGNVAPGDAQYLLTQARKEVKRLDKLARRARHQV
ncbi:hypothetical protein DFH06DRAFT_1324830 [Mycena polygramma]|nr:hypothetical protein DFH06DRAFT_1324830 [Mycena polygramma]